MSHRAKTSGSRWSWSRKSGATQNRHVRAAFRVCPEFHEAVEFVCSLGQTIPHLSSRAQAKLRGQIIGGPKTNGLRSLQHEMRVAGTISRLGFDISFSDLEGTGGYDFLAERSGLAYEIEAKCLSAYVCQPIPPQDADKLYLEYAEGLTDRRSRKGYPFSTSLRRAVSSPDRRYLCGVVDGCNTAARTRSAVTVHGGDIRVEFLGTVSDAPLAQLRHAALLDAIGNGTYVHVSDRLPRVIARLRSEQPNRFSRKLAATISDASKSKFTEARPAVIWAHVDYIGTRHFEYLAHSEDGNSFLDAIALATFRSSKREHITQLAFSGGAHPIISSGNVISSFKQVGIRRTERPV